MSDAVDLADLPDPLPVATVAGPLDADLEVPGSKSITNRALVAAALADGRSTLRNVLRADDTEAMIAALRALGVVVDEGAQGPRSTTLVVTGTGGRVSAAATTIDARLSGTTSRFLLPVLALGGGPHHLDGEGPLRLRPMADGIAAARELGADVVELGAPGHLPVEVRRGADGTAAARRIEVDGSVSSQFLSGLLLAAPCRPQGVELSVRGTLVSRSYVEMTVAVMRAFGAEVDWIDEATLAVAPSGYRGTDHRVEPDASAASYAFAAAAICGGRARVDGLGTASHQGDVAFVDVLEAMGVSVERSARHLEVVVAPGAVLRGVEVDLGDLSDTAQTLAAVAPFAAGPTEVTGIGFIRAKETDRLAAVVHELRRLGGEADETADGFVIRPGPLHGATVHTYDDHRMAMAFALIGLRVPGVRIADPGCVAKTFPGFWSWLAGLRRSARDR